MKKKTEFEIPIDNAINEFGFHLKSHPRTILSAKFGDGKTYFLSKFIKKRNRSFVFITLHPINYQVLENKDIFELIKRDVLFQITVNNMLSEDLDIDDQTALAFYIQNNFMGLTESTLSYISQLHSSTEVAKGVLAALSLNNLLKELKNKVFGLKKKYKSTYALEEFLNKADTIPILEEDVVTKIIQDSIDEYKTKHTKKRIVLLIEDMDRLDPAHLFRIMNVFSAHLDTDEKYFIENSRKYFYNKFHFDNIVFVMDYNNTRRIFEHFYGENTNFEGYIQKFASKGLFKYSLEEERCKFVQEKTAKITELPLKYIENVISNDVLLGKNIRIIVDSFDDIDSQIKERPICRNKQIHLGMLRLYIIMKRIGIDETLLVAGYRNVYDEIGSEMVEYIIGYLMLLFGNNTTDYFYCKNVLEKKGNIE
ncbi:MAG: hypothetical protein IKS53_01525 [Bacteroidales bacterium]|nr:hypothetical protein [Bacteroidales bacterium]